VTKPLHPAIRIICLIVLGTFVSLGQPWVVIVTGLALVAIGIGILQRDQIDRIVRMVRRLKWLFLSILVIYLWFTPGTPIQLPSDWVDAAYLPSREGVITGLTRMGALVVLVIAATLLVTTTSREQLALAIYWLASPAAWLGFPRERLAIRMSLVFETIEEVQLLMKLARERHAAMEGSRLQNLGRALGELFGEVVSRAETTPLVPIEISSVTRPPWMQWAYPVALLLVLWLLAGL
jgi:energy-coupling factor transport system permease protein